MTVLSSIKKGAILVIAIMGMVTAAWAQTYTASEIKNLIETKAPELAAMVDGNTVTVTGSKTDLSQADMANFLTLSLAAGVTVIWKAELRGSVEWASVIFVDGDGYFEVTDGGFIENTAINSPAITLAGAGTRNISGGTVKGRNSQAIYINGVSSLVVTISGNALITSENTNTTSTVSATINFRAGSLNITGGTVENTAANANARTILVIGNGPLNISGGTVSSAGGSAIHNESSGNNITTISDGAVVTSAASRSSSNGTIYIMYKNDDGYARVRILGGIVENTGGGFVINRPTFQDDEAIVEISKGQVKTDLVYNGSEQTGIELKHDFAYEIIDDGVISATNAGNYSATVRFYEVAKLKYRWAEDETDDDLQLDWSIGKAAGVFGNPSALNTTYTPTLTLANVTPAAGYTWTTPTKTLDVSKSGQPFAAIYTDPSGNYHAASGYITVNVAKAAGTLNNPAPINTTYTPTLTLAGLTLPANYAWDEDETQVLNAGNGQLFEAIYTDPSGNYHSADGKITVNVAKAEQSALAAATLASKTQTSVTLTEVAGCEYRLGEGEWQESAIFDDLTADTEYSFYQRKAATANYNASPASEELKVTTDVPTSIKSAKKSDDKQGIIFAKNIVSDKAEISIILPADEKTSETKIAIYDMTGNVVYDRRGVSHTPTKIEWDLRNTAGRFVANGSYLVIAEVKSASGQHYHYSAKLGVKR